MKRHIHFINYVALTHTGLILGAVLVISGYALLGHYQELRKNNLRLETQYMDDQRLIVTREVKAAVERVKNQRREYDTLVRQEVIQRSREGLGLAQRLYNAYRERLPEEQLKALLLKALASHRFFEGDQGRYFVQDQEGYTLLRDGQILTKAHHVSQIKNPVIARMMKHLMDVGKKKPEGFTTSTNFRPGEKGFNPRLFYYTTFEPYGWYIGTIADYRVAEKREQKKLLRELAMVRFNAGSGGYLFAMDIEGILLMHPFKPKLVGQNILSHPNENGREIYKEIHTLALEKGEGFLEYDGKRPHGLEVEPQLTYLELDKSWGWILGSGIFLNQGRNALWEEMAVNRSEFQRKASDTLVSTGLITVVFLTLHLFIRRANAREMERYIEKFSMAAKSNQRVPMDDIRFKEFRRLARYANKMVEGRKLVERELTDQTTLDPQSLAWNRRHFTELLDTEILRCRRYATPISALALGLEYPSDIHETQGRAAQDYMIREFANITSHCLRSVDVMGRLSKEGFGIFLPQTKARAALEVAKRIHATVENHAFEFKSIHIPVTVSIGVTTAHPVDEVSHEDLMAMADRELTVARTQGGNQVFPGQADT